MLRRLLPLALATLCAPLARASGVPASPGTGGASDVRADAGVEVAFATETQTIWLDRSQVIAFRVAAPAEEDRTFTVAIDAPGCVTVLRVPEVLAGESVGYLRVRGLAVGDAALRMGGARLAVTVRPVPASAPLNRAAVRIVGPAREACVWGTFAVGVEWTPGAQEHDDMVRAGTVDATTVRLVLPDGRRLDGVESVPPHRSAQRHVRFDVDADRLREGPLALVAEIARPDGSTIASEPVRVRVVRVAADDLVALECEDSVDGERPQGYGNALLRLGGDPGASGGTFVANDRTYPIWTAPVQLERAGRYQAFVRCRGDFGAGAFPSIGLCVDAPNVPRRSARVVDRRWQRVPLGPPLTLEAGARLLALRFANDATVSRTSDRNLFLDRLELLRLHDDEARPVEATASLAANATPPAMDDAVERDADGLWVAFDRPLDGLFVNGRLEVLGTCRWDDMESVPAPRVELVLNGAVLSAQQAARPVFLVDRAEFADGENTLALVATLADGQRASAPVQTLVARGDPGPAPARAAHRFSVRDERWGAAWEGVMTDRGQESGQTVALARNGAEAVLELPAELAGSFELFFESRAGTAKVRYTVEAAGEEVPGEGVSGEVELRGWWDYKAGGVLELPGGEQRLVLRVELDPAGEADVNKGFNLRSVILREARGPDRFPPRARVVWPPRWHVAHDVDAVVVEAYDDDALEWADVLVDGEPLASYGHVPEGAGHVTLPLVLRDVAPGEHTLAVRVGDRAGHVGESAEVPFHVAEERPPYGGPYGRAVRLLDRFAFGPEPRELAALLVEGEDAWLERRLTDAGAGDAAALGYVLAQRGSRIDGNYDRGVMGHWLRTPNPVRARAVAWIENHFSTWEGKTGAPTEWREHLRFQALGTAPFGELLLASATSPAMLHYLDQSQSYAQRINENYARELLELHTVGVDGGYEQGDVTRLAELLCGLTIAEEAPPSGEGRYMMREFRFDPDLGDGAEREVLGARFEEAAPGARVDRLRHALETLAAHPSTARFVCTKLAEHYVSVPAPEALVEDLERVFTESGGDLASVLRAIAAHDAFWDEALPPRVARPFDFGLRVARATGLYQVDYAVADYLRKSGMAPFDRETPDGYPEQDERWVDTNALMQRWRLAQAIPWAVRRLVPDGLRRHEPGDRERWRRRVIDHAAVRLTGWTLSEESTRAALEFLAQSEEQAWKQVDDAAVLVCRMPEASLK